MKDFKNSTLAFMTFDIPIFLSLFIGKNGLKIMSDNFLARVIATYVIPHANSKSPISIITFGIVKPCPL